MTRTATFSDKFEKNFRINQAPPDGQRQKFADSTKSNEIRHLVADIVTLSLSAVDARYNEKLSTGQLAGRDHNSPEAG